MNNLLLSAVTISLFLSSVAVLGNDPYLGESKSRSVITDTDPHVDVCNRTLEVKISLEKALKKTCGLIGAAELGSLVELNVTTEHTSKIMLRLRDFDGLFSLKQLKISNYYMEALPEQIFRDLSQLKVLVLDTSIKTALSYGTFARLGNLRELSISSMRYPNSN